MSNHFDEVTKALAGGRSRRDVLRLIGSGIAGVVLTAMGGGSVNAAPSECAIICGKTAFTSGPAHAACLQACRECGGDASRLCRNFSTNQTICCAPGSTCCYGFQGNVHCCPTGTLCCGNQCCGTGQVCSFGPSGPVCVTPSFPG